MLCNLKRSYPLFPKAITACIVLLCTITTSNAQFEYHWGFSIGGPTSDRVTDMKLDPDGNILLAGMYSDTVDFDPGSGVSELLADDLLDAFLAKYSGNGEFLWSKDINMSVSQSANNQLPSLDVDPEGNSFVVGFNRYFSNRNIYFAKYDEEGTLVWDYEVPGQDKDEGWCIRVLESGDCLVAGIFSNSKDFDPGTDSLNLISEGDDDLFIAKYSSTGDLIWAKNIGGPLDSQTKINQMTTDQNGAIYLAGELHKTFDFDPPNSTTNSSISCSSRKAFIAKYDENFEFLWVKKIESSQNSNCYFIKTDQENNILVTGRFQDSLDLDTGPAESFVTGLGGIESYLAKYSPQGELIWGFPITSTFGDEGHSINLDPYNNVHITGNCWADPYIDLNPSSEESLFQNAGVYDLFYAIYDENGNYLDAFTIGGEEVDVGIGIEIDQEGDIVLAAWYASSNVDWDMTDDFDIFSAHTTDFVISKFSYARPTRISGPNRELVKVDIFPNPVRSGHKIYLELPAADELYIVEIRDSYGRLVGKYRDAHEIHAPSAPGIYQLMVRDDSEIIAVQKLAVIK